MLSVADALAQVLKNAKSFGSEKIPLEKSFGRVLAEDIRADRDYPPFNRSAMDGYALRSAEYEPGRVFTIAGAVFAGDKMAVRKYPGAVAVKIMTGAAVPAGFDAVVRREDASVAGDAVSFSADPVTRWHNVSVMGEDLKRGSLVSLKGHRLDQSAATLLASLGIARPLVQKLPRVAILTTGNEIIPLGRKPQPQQIRNSNVFALQAMLAAYGIRPSAVKHVADEKKPLMQAIRPLLAADIILLTGGVSAGDSDYVPEILGKLGVKQVFHKTAMKPGKPLWFGIRGKTRVFAIPGNPWSSQIVFKAYVEPYLRRALGLSDALTLSLPLASERRKKDSLRHYFPVRIANKAGYPSELEAIDFNGSGDIRAGLGSDGLAVQPAEKKELARGEIVEFIPW